MQEVFNQGWYSGNESVKYPLHPDASGITAEGEELPSELISDIRIISTRPDTFYISGVTCSEHLFSIVIASSRGIEAAATIPQPVKPLTHYALEAFSNDISGVIAVGHPFTYGQWQFTSPEQGKLDSSAAIIMNPWPVTSIGCREMLKDEVWFQGGNDIEVSVQDMVVSETRKPENTRNVKAIVFKLVEFFGEDGEEEGFRSKYLSPCAVRPDNGECDYITSVGGATPDCDGNIDITFTTDNYMQELFEPNSEGTDCGPILKPIENHIVERPISYGRCGDDLCSTEDNENAEEQQDPTAPPQQTAHVDLQNEVYPVEGYAMIYFEGKIEAPPGDKTYVTCDRSGIRTTAVFLRGEECGIAWDVAGNIRKFIYDGKTLSLEHQSMEVETATQRVVMSLVYDETNHTVTGTLLGIPKEYTNHSVQELGKLTVTYHTLGKVAFYLKESTCIEWTIE